MQDVILQKEEEEEEEYLNQLPEDKEAQVASLNSNNAPILTIAIPHMDQTDER